jgi:hypothetical protein
MELVKSMTSKERTVSDVYKDVGDLQNVAQTCAAASTKSAHPRSGPVRYALVGPDGKVWSTFGSAQLAADIAKELWPELEQDEDRTGHGWDVQVVMEKSDGI